MTTAAEANRDQILALMQALRAGEHVPDAEFDAIMVAQYEGVIRDEYRDLASQLDAICGENPRGVRNEHLEAVRRVRQALLGGRA